MASSLEAPSIAAASVLDQADAVEALLARLERAARQPIPPAEFFQQAVEGLLGALQGLSASAWIQTDAGLDCIASAQGGAQRGERLDRELERRLAAHTLQHAEPRMLAPGAMFEPDCRNDSSALQLLCPRTEAGIAGFVLRVALSPDAPLNLRETAGGLLAAVAEMGLNFQLHDRLRRLEQREDFWGRLDAALLAMHAPQGLKLVAPAIAEQVRRLIGCDRVSLLVRRGGSCRLAGISSQTTVDRKGRQVRLLERLGAEVLRGGGSMTAVVGSGAGPFSPALDAYLDQSQSRTVHCEPLPDDRPRERGASGVLVAESFSAADPARWKDRMPVLARHAAQALARAVEDERRGWRRLLFPFRTWTAGLIWAAAATAASAGVAALALVPGDFKVEAEGRLMPVQTRGVFAPADGIVTAVFVDDDSTVVSGQPLAKLTDPDLDLERSRLVGELQTAAARLQAVQARRKLRLRDPDTDSAALSIEEEELKATLSGLQSQLEVVERQEEQLTLRSPFAGQAVRWDLKTVLHSLPVRHGQRLMDVYDPEGGWRLELAVPDDVAGYVREAQQRDQTPPVEFVFHSNAGRRHMAALSRFEDATELDSDGQLTVRGMVHLASDSLPDRRRGATVLAKIHCGRRSLGFIWFRELIEFAHRHLLF